MITKVTLILIWSLVIFGYAANAQPVSIPKGVLIEILKAEDARRYDKTLEGLLKSPNEQTRARAALAAGRIGNDAAVPVLTELLASDPSVSVQAVSAFALGEIESILAADQIIGSLKGYEAPRAPLTGNRQSGIKALVPPRVVEAAGKIAAANASHQKAGELREAILDVLERETVHRETILLALTAALRAAPRDAKRERPDRTDIVIAKFLASTDPRVRADAANTLTRVRAKNANHLLRAMLVNDAEPIARANAARALGAAEDTAAVDMLVTAATSDTDARVRVSSVRALAALRDARAAEPLLKRGQTLFASYKLAKKPNFIPVEHSEFVEVSIAIGRVMANTRDARAVDLFRQFGKLDRGASPEVYIARLRVSPGRGDDEKNELTNWRQYSSLAQIIGEFAALEPANDEGKRMKTEAPVMLRPLAKAYAEADPAAEADTIMAAPDVLRAYAAFKTADLSELLRTALKNKDTFIRATAAELLADQPATQENIDALNQAFEYSLINDAKYNDATLATLDALFKLDKRKSLPALELAAGSPDHLVRNRVFVFLKDDEFKNSSTLPAILRNIDSRHLWEVKPVGGISNRLGQILNTDADYARAATRKNGGVQAILTTEKGAFTIQLLPEDAPLTVENFIKLTRANYFNGLEVHRVVPNFVMQDGDPRGDGNGGPGWTIRCELNMIPYDRGAVGMALSGKDTGGSQWFVTHSPQPHLDGGYTVFGRVNETDMKVVDKIVRGDKIISVRILEAASTQSSPRPRVR